MKTIRRNVFETNSSSVHCVTILSDKEYQNIENGKAVLDYHDYVEITPQFIQEKIAKDKKRIQENKDSIAEADSLDPEKMVKLLERMIPDLERLKEEYHDYDDDEEDDEDILSADDYGCSEEEFNWAIEFLNDKDNIDTYGSGYDASSYDSRTIDGVKVHVLSCSGYDN